MPFRLGKDRTRQRLEALLRRIQGSAKPGAPLPDPSIRETPPQAIPPPESALSGLPLAPPGRPPSPRTVPSAKPTPPMPPRSSPPIPPTSAWPAAAPRAPPPSAAAPAGPAVGAMPAAPPASPAHGPTREGGASQGAPAAPVPAAALPPAGDPAGEGAGTEEAGVASRLARIEESLETLQDLRELSELLSVKYNPFLEPEEQGLEERHAPVELLAPRRASPQPAAVPLAPAPPVEADWPGPSAHQPGRGPAGPHGPGPRPPPVHAHPHPQQGTRPYDPPALPAHSVLEEAAASHRLVDPAGGGGPASPAASRPRFFGRGRSAAGGPREAFLAIHWFTYLSQGTDPSIIFLYLDHCLRVGWLDEEDHDWLERLAEGLATRRPGASWSDYGLDVKRLADNHLRNLRFLDKLLGATLQHGEAQYLQQTVDMLLQEE